jgi:hypothetical protein
MAVQHTDIFHCQKCGRVVYQSHGDPGPRCCEEPMVCAVADIAEERPPEELRPPGYTPGLEDHALLDELTEQSKLCRSIEDTEDLPFQDLARRLDSLHSALLDQFEDEERGGDLAKVLEVDPRYEAQVGHFRDEHRQFLSALERFIQDLRQGQPYFRGWDEVCERLDSLVADFRQHEEAENELVRQAMLVNGTPWS